MSNKPLFSNLRIIGYKIQQKSISEIQNNKYIHIHKPDVNQNPCLSQLYSSTKPFYGPLLTYDIFIICKKVCTIC